MEEAIEMIRTRIQAKNLRQKADGYVLGRYVLGRITILVQFETVMEVETFKNDIKHGAGKTEWEELVKCVDPDASGTISVDIFPTRQLDTVTQFLEADVFEDPIQLTYCSKFGHWYWTADDINWQTTEKIVVEEGPFKGKKPGPDDVARLELIEVYKGNEETRKPDCKQCQQALDHALRKPESQEDFFAFNGIKLCISWDDGITWNPTKDIEHMFVTKTTEEFMAAKEKSLVYDMTSPCKGKVGIIAIDTFSGPSLAAMNAYKQDTEDLAALWCGLGFQVYTLEKRNNRKNFTAEDLLSSVHKYAKLLSEEDKCAVLIIMTYGGDGFLCGTDGSTIRVDDLLHVLSNTNCDKMAGKPKMVILQTCNDGNVGNGHYVETGLDKSVSYAGPEPYIQPLSDIIVCHACIKGSNYIQNLVTTFAEHAWKEDIYTLLTTVNKNVLSELLNDVKSEQVMLETQVPRYQSSLRKPLFFFPRGDENRDFGREKQIKKAKKKAEQPTSNNQPTFSKADEVDLTRHRSKEGDLGELIRREEKNLRRRFSEKPQIYSPEREARMAMINTINEKNNWGKADGFQTGSLTIFERFETKPQLDKFKTDFQTDVVKTEYLELVKNVDPDVDTDTVRVENNPNEQLDKIRRLLEADALESPVQIAYCDESRHWYWAADHTNWQTTDKIIVEDGAFVGKKPMPDDILTLEIIEKRNVEGRIKPSYCQLCKTKCKHPERTTGSQEDFYAFDGIELRMKWDDGMAWTHKEDLQDETVPRQTDEFMTKMDDNSSVYDTIGLNKGKVAIIAIPEFSSPTLCDMEAYKQDTEDLAALWSGLGFQVYIPERRQKKMSPTAEDVLSAVQKYAGMLSEEDKCAVLIILTHGGDDYLCGTDGSTIRVEDLLHVLSNTNCEKMAAKPKIVVIHACRQGMSDDVATFYHKSIPSAGGDHHLQPPLDTVVCFPCVEGYNAYVSQKGSIYIRNLVTTFTEHAWKEDIYTLLTRVNESVSRELLKTDCQGHKALEKQVPQFTSSLRKSLVFFPRGQKLGRTIDQNRVYLEDKLNPDHLILPLHERGLLTVVQKDELIDLPTFMKTELLLNLLRQATTNVFYEFIEVLKKDNQLAIMRRLTSDDNIEITSRRFPAGPHIWCPNTEESIRNLGEEIAARKWGKLEGHNYGSHSFEISFSTTEELENLRHNLRNGGVIAFFRDWVAKHDPGTKLERVIIDDTVSQEFDVIKSYMEADVFPGDIELTFCYDKEHWYWTADDINWQTTDAILVQKGEHQGKKPKPQDVEKLTDRTSFNSKPRLPYNAKPQSGSCVLCEKVSKHPEGTPRIRPDFFAFNGITLHVLWDDEITWNVKQNISSIPVNKSTAEFISADRPEAYEMTGPNKGKAGIIAIHSFSRPMDDIPAYIQDTENLAALWDGIGFNVYVPEKRGEKICPTAWQMYSAVKKYAKELSQEDKCAILIILTHGGDDFLAGTDGSAIKTDDLLHLMGNDNCKSMKDKPKIFVFQACRTAAPRDQEYVNTSEQTKNRSQISLSDQIVCFTCTPGDSAYFCTSPVPDAGNTESIYIKAFVETFASKADKADIYTMLGLVCEEVSKEAMKDSIGIVRQIPQFYSTLRKAFFLFPNGHRNQESASERNNVKRKKRAHGTLSDTSHDCLQSPPEGTDDQSTEVEAPMEID